MIARLATVLLGAALLATALPAIAEAQTKVVVLEFRGPGASRVRGQAVRGLSGQGVEVVDASEAESAASRLGVSLDDADGLAAVAAELQVNAFVEGRVNRVRRRWSAQLVVRQGSDGEQVEETSFTGRNLNRVGSSVRDGVWRRLGSAIQSAEAPAARRQPEVVEQRRPIEQVDDEEDPPGFGGDDGGDEEEEEEAEDDDGGGGTAGSPLEVAAGLRVFTRSLDYTDDIFGELRAYAMAGAPAVFGDISWFPAAHFTTGFPTWLGITLELETAFLLTSSDSDGVEYPTSSAAWLAGARLRVPVGNHEIGGLIGYGGHSYSIDDATTDMGQRDPQVPAVSYTFVKIGGDARVHLTDRLVMRARLGWKFLTGMGEIQKEDWFPRMTGGGLDLGVGFGFEIGGGIEARIDFDLRRYFFSMNPEPSDTWIAGGALDQYFAGSLGIAWRMEGSAPSGSAAEEEELDEPLDEEEDEELDVRPRRRAVEEEEEVEEVEEEVEEEEEEEEAIEEEEEERPRPRPRRRRSSRRRR